MAESSRDIRYWVIEARILISSRVAVVRKNEKARWENNYRNSLQELNNELL